MSFPPILVINLDDRQDRWEQIQADFSSWPVPMNRIDAVRAKSGWKGCTLSHRKCIQTAKQKDWPWVLCIEDDARPLEGSYEKFCELLPILWNSRDQWDVFNGGFSTTHSAHLKQLSPPLLQGKGWGTQFCLVHSGAYDMFIDDISPEPPEAIDNLYSRDKYRMWCTAPHLTDQREGKSDVENTITDRTEGTQKSNEMVVGVVNRHKLALGLLTIGLVGTLAMLSKRR